MKKCVRAVYTPKSLEGNFKFSNVSSPYGANVRYFTYEGRAILPVVGEFHFSRYDRRDWERELAKLREEGLSGVSAYAFWNHIERKCGKFDFTGNNDIREFISLCKKLGLQVVLRLGPWCHGEARYGGFPDYLRAVIGRRTNNPLYLYFVKRFWSRLYEEVKEFLDGQTVIAIQLENEYPFGISHIAALRKIAEEIGFKTPFFTMTAWPSDKPDNRFLPMFGGYPEAPWTQHKRRLEAGRRFAISGARSETEIGEDLLGKRDRSSSGDFGAYPYAGCEVGTGNQVTAHRRPIIGDKDGYGVAFAKLASGMNWLGYYMYHGGRNPEGRPLQETRASGYPNDYPVMDYDFQAPISKDGAIRRHGSRLRLMHTFLRLWDDSFSETEAFFPDVTDVPYLSVRAREEGGYVFVSNYERGLTTRPEALDVEIELNGGRLTINGIELEDGAIFFFPVMCDIGGVKFDYVLAQPIAKIEREGVLHAYFMRVTGSSVRLSRGGNETVAAGGKLIFEDGERKVVLHFLDEEDALDTRFISGHIVRTNGAVYRLGGKNYLELSDGGKLMIDGVAADSFPLQEGFKGVRLEKCDKTALPYDRFMFSKGERAYYRLTIDEELLKGRDDVEITLSVEALNLQIFWGRVLVDDYFNYDKKCVFRLGRLKERLLQKNELIIRTCAKTASGKGAPYMEVELVNGCTAIELESVRLIKTVEFKL